MTDDHDDLIRDALRAEAEGVEASDDLLARIRVGARAARAPWRRHGALLLAATAVVALVVGLAVILTIGEDEQTVDLVDDPQTTSTTEPLDLMGAVPPPRFPCSADRAVVAQVFMRPDASEGEIDAMADALERARSSEAPPITSISYVDQAERLIEVEEALADQPEVLDGLTADMVPSYFAVDLPEGSDGLLPSEVADMAGVLGTATTQCDDSSPPPGGAGDAPPVQAVAVTEQGRVVVIDTATGEVTRDLGGFDDPTDPEVATSEGGAFSVTGVALHPNGRDVYVETCCEPAAGAVFTVPIDGSAPLGSGDFEPVSFGYGIDISTDGRWMAYVAAGTVAVVELDGGAPRLLSGDDDTAEWVQAAINADGSEVAAERTIQRDADGRTVRSDVRRWTVADGSFEDLTVDEGRFIPIWTDGGRSFASAPAPGEQLRDANVDASGAWILEVTEGGRLVGLSETTIEIPGGPYVAADW